MARLGVITALAADVVGLGRHVGEQTQVIVTGDGSAERARRGAEDLASRGVAGLVSFGLATGLAPVLRPGDLVIAESVVLPSGTAIACDESWREALVRRLVEHDLELRVARLAGGEHALGSPSQKQKVFQATFAAALDTESHAVAEVARAAGLPFLAVRAVVDPANESRPSTANRPGFMAGGTRPLAMLAQLARSPFEVCSLWRFVQHGKLALSVLRRVADLGPEPFAFHRA
jgi:adenosylhomocysteine nucleosidase